MSQLLDILLTAGRRQVDKEAVPPATIPVVSRGDRIIAEGHARRVSCGRINPSADTAMVYGAQIGFLHGQVQVLCNELNTYAVQRNVHLEYVTVPCKALGIDVVLGVDYEPGEPADHDLDSPMCGPGEPESLEIFEVWLNGADILDVLDANVTAQLFEAATELREAARRAGGDL